MNDSLPEVLLSGIAGQYIGMAQVLCKHCVVQPINSLYVAVIVAGLLMLQPWCFGRSTISGATLNSNEPCALPSVQ